MSGVSPVLKEFFSSTKRIVIKIIPHHAESIYKLEVTHRHVAVVVVCALVFAASLVTFQIGAVSAADAQVHRLQQTDAQQRQQLMAFSKQTRDIMTRLSVMQRNEREIRKLTGIAPSVAKNVKAAKKSAPVAKTAAPSQLGGSVHTAGARPGVSQQVSLWQRVATWIRERSGGAPVTFAAESAELAMLNFQSRDALAESNALAVKAAAIAQAKREAAIAHQRYLDAIPSMWPTDGYISSGFGYRYYPDAEFHPGLDIVNDYGAPVYATAAGVVEEAGWDSGYGYKIVIDHGNGYETWYAHNERMLVSVGESVRKGEQIAEVGSTGFATGPHCHYEVVLWGKPIDPTPYLNGIPAEVAKN